MKTYLLLMRAKNNIKLLLMNKAVVTLLISSFCNSKKIFANYFSGFFSLYNDATGGGCFERTEISFISFRWWIQTGHSVPCQLEKQPDRTRQIHRRRRWCSLQSAFCQEKKTKNQIYLNTKQDRLHDVSGLMFKFDKLEFVWLTSGFSVHCCFKKCSI